MDPIWLPNANGLKMMLLFIRFENYIKFCVVLSKPIVKTLLLYEGCQKSSWTPMIKASNEPDFDIHYFISLK